MRLRRAIWPKAELACFDLGGMARPRPPSSARSQSSWRRRRLCLPSSGRSGRRERPPERRELVGACRMGTLAPWMRCNAKQRRGPTRGCGPAAHAPSPRVCAGSVCTGSEQLRSGVCDAFVLKAVRLVCTARVCLYLVNKAVVENTLLLFFTKGVLYY